MSKRREHTVGAERKHETHSLLMYEDELPADMSDEEYDAWFARSHVVCGVRMGPRVRSNG